MKLWGDEWDWDAQWKIYKEPIKSFIKKKELLPHFQCWSSEFTIHEKILCQVGK